MQEIAIPTEWVVEELNRLHQERPTMLDSVLNSLLTGNEELRWSVVVRAYMQRKINLGKAAELLGLHELELRGRFIELGIPLRLGAADVAEARAEVEAVRSWYRASE